MAEDPSLPCAPSSSCTWACTSLWVAPGNDTALLNAVQDFRNFVQRLILFGFSVPIPYSHKSFWFSALLFLFACVVVRTGDLSLPFSL